MDYKIFERLISAPLTAINMELANCQSARQSNDLFWMKIKLSATINRTIRQTLQYPDFAQQYLNKQAQATQDDNIPTTSE